MTSTLELTLHCILSELQYMNDLYFANMFAFQIKEEPDEPDMVAAKEALRAVRQKYRNIGIERER